MSKTGIEIINEKELYNLFKYLDTTNKETSSQIKRVIKAPFAKMRKEAKKNLIAQGSVISGNLLDGLSIGSASKRARGKFFAFFGGRYIPPKSIVKIKKIRTGRDIKRSRNPLSGKFWKTNAFHLVNSGTVTRRNKKGKSRGAVGKSNNPTNSSYRVGFADRAIKKGLMTIEREYIKGFSRVYADIIKKQGDTKTTRGAPRL